MKWDLDEGLTEREYPESGTVTISTKEYRDLVMDASGWFAKAKAEHEMYMNCWRKSNRLESEAEDYRDFFGGHPQEYVTFLEWKKGRKTD